MLRPALVSIGLHVMVVMAFTVSWPAFDKEDDLKNQLVVIEAQQCLILLKILILIKD